MRESWSNRLVIGAAAGVLCAGVFLLGGCRRTSDAPSVVVYTALDQIYSDAILEAFAHETGIKVKPVYDTEAAKTVGLANRIIAEAAHPQCDVFWNNEVVRTVGLQRRGLLEPYESPAASDIPASYKDADGYWTGFAARARVLIVNTNLCRDLPENISVQEMVQARWTGKVALAYPLFGTTSTHAAAWFTSWGPANARDYFERLKANTVVVVDGNAAVKDLVARGEVPIGFTDTDDAYAAIQERRPVRMVFPDQGADQSGTLVIPNTVSMIKGCPHPEEARKLIDFLVSRRVEELLARCGSAQMPVRPGVPVPEGVPNLGSIKAMEVDWGKVSESVEESAKFLSSLFIR